jgi:hypothetical protein
MISSMHSSAAARPTSGCDPAPRPSVTQRQAGPAARLRHRQRLGVGVGDDEVDTLQPGIDHVVDGIAATAANPEHGDAGLQLGDVRLLQIDGHGTRSFLWHGPHRRVGQFCEFKNSL